MLWVVPGLLELDFRRNSKKDLCTGSGSLVLLRRRGFSVGVHCTVHHSVAPFSRVARGTDCSLIQRLNEPYEFGICFGDYVISGIRF